MKQISTPRQPRPRGLPTLLRRRFMAVAFTAVALGIGVATPKVMASPVLPPELTLPIKINSEHELLDYDLKSWFDTITPTKAGKKPAKSVDLPSDIELLQKLRERSSEDKYLYKELENQISEILAAGNSKKGHSPVLPYIIDEILQLNNLSPAITAAWEDKLRGLNLGSCPEKDLLLQDISLASAPATKLLDRILLFDSGGFRREALKKLMPALSHSLGSPSPQGSKARSKSRSKSPAQGAVKATAKEAAEAKGKLRREFFDKYPKYALANKRFFIGALGVSNAEFKPKAKKPRMSCKAREKLAISTAASGKKLSAVKPLLLRAERCYRRYGFRSRLNYWTRVSKSLKRHYGFAGKFFAERKQAGIYWGRDKFKTAISRTEALIKEARAGKHRTEESEAVFLLARIHENNANTTAAIKEFFSYAQKFPKGPHINDALKKLTVLQFQAGLYPKALESSLAMTRYHLSKPADQRDTGYLSFALYWAGRLYYKLGKKDQAIDYWQKLIRDYYTTFYGALGHHTLEVVTGKSLAMTPTASPPFKGLILTKGLSHRAKVRVATIESLLQIGDKRDASCEFEELLAHHSATEGKNGSAKGKPAKTSMAEVKKAERFKLLKSMYLYALGEWLEAIKTYSSLPRSFRKALPRGMERMLFPRKYAQLVDDNAIKLNLDSSLILAIIRQESVFNNRARSPVGARGLMQLMPATAYMEARRMTTHRSLRKKSRRWIKGNLYKADTNIAIGVHHVFSLLRRYENPILVLTSYNASPSATRRWLKNIPSEDQLAFIEQIPYEETRNYVKLVMRNYFYYKRWYPDSDSPDGKHLTMLVNNILGDSKSSSLR